MWVTSHLGRAIKTAQAVADAGLDFPQPAIEENLGEQNFGDWQGLSWDEMRKKDMDAYEFFWAAPTRTRPPGGESFADQIKRTGDVMGRLTIKHQGRDIVAIAHGGERRAHQLGERGAAIFARLRHPLGRSRRRPRPHLGMGGRAPAQRLARLRTVSKPMIIQLAT